MPEALGSIPKTTGKEGSKKKSSMLGSAPSTLLLWVLPAGILLPHLSSKALGFLCFVQRHLYPQSLWFCSHEGNRGVNLPAMNSPAFWKPCSGSLGVTQALSAVCAGVSGSFPHCLGFAVRWPLCALLPLQLPSGKPLGRRQCPFSQPVKTP